MRRLGSLSLSNCAGRGDEEGCAYDLGLVLFNGEFGTCGWGEAVGVVFAEGGGVFLFECDGYTGAPGTTGVACVYKGCQ